MVLLLISLWTQFKFVYVVQNICASPFHSFEGFIGWREMIMCLFCMWLLQYHCQWFNTSLFNSTRVSSLRHQSRYFHTNLVTRTPTVSLLKIQSHYLTTSISKVYFDTSLVISTPISLLEHQSHCLKSSLITWTPVYQRFTSTPVSLFPHQSRYSNTTSLVA